MLRELDIIIKAKEMVSKELTGIRRHLGVFYTETTKQFTAMRRVIFSARSALLAIGLGVGARQVFKSFIAAATDVDKWKTNVKLAQGAWTAFQRELMDAGVMQWLNAALEAATGHLESMKGKGQSLGPAVVSALDSIARAAGYLGTAFELVKGGVLAIGTVGFKAASKLTAAFAAVFDQLGQQFDTVKDSPFWKWLLGEENAAGLSDWAKNATKGLDDVTEKLEGMSDVWMKELDVLVDPTRLKPHERMNQMLDDIAGKANVATKALGKMGADDALLGPMLKSIQDTGTAFGYLNHQIKKAEHSQNKLNEAAAGKRAKSAWDAILNAGKAAAKAVGDAADRARERWAAVRSVVEDVAERVLQSIADSTIEYAEGGLRSVEERWRAVQSILKDVSAMFLRMAVQAASAAIGGAVASAFAAKGGIFNTGGNTPIPLHAMAGGGVTRGPELVLRGEGAKPEAVVPLPDGKNIPVKMQGGAPVVNNYWNFQAVDQHSLQRWVYANRDLFAGAGAQASRENPRAYR